MTDSKTAASVRPDDSIGAHASLLRAMGVDAETSIALFGFDCSQGDERKPNIPLSAFAEQPSDELLARILDEQKRLEGIHGRAKRARGSLNGHVGDTQNLSVVFEHQGGHRQPLTRELDAQIVADLGDVFEPEDELVEGLIARGALSVIYGDSNSGKTYLTLDLTAAIANGQHGWMGRHVEGGLVVYIAAEAPRSVRRRMQAYMRERGRDGMQRFVVINSPVNFYDNTADARAVVQAIRKAEAATGERCVLVVGDTLARLSAGANENAGQDMGVVLGHVDQIREATDAHFMLIHHCGKDAARGMRGWSGLRAACDTEIEVSVDATGAHVAEITKQRDLDGKGDRIGFRLVPVELGRTKWGKPATACTVEPIEAPVKRRPGKTSESVGAVAEFLRSQKAGIAKKLVVAHFKGRYDHGTVYRAIQQLEKAGVAHCAVNVVALTSEGRQ